MARRPGPGGPRARLPRRPLRPARVPGGSSDEPPRRGVRRRPPACVAARVNVAGVAGWCSSPAPALASCTSPRPAVRARPRRRVGRASRHRCPAPRSPPASRRSAPGPSWPASRASRRRGARHHHRGRRPGRPAPGRPRGDGRLIATSGEHDPLLDDRRASRSRETAAVARAAAPVRLTGEGSMAPAVAGTQEWRVDGKDLRGLVSAPCGAGGTDLWLLAGGAGPGRQERLILTNPGANPVTTDVTVHGTAGQLGDPVVETVAPGGRVSVLLDARYGEEQRPAVHVRSDGGGVQATLTDTWVERQHRPRRRDDGRRGGPRRPSRSCRESWSTTGPAAVRVAVPGDQDAVVRVSVLNRDGLVPWTGESVLSVAAGSVGELPLDRARRRHLRRRSCAPTCPSSRRRSAASATARRPASSPGPPRRPALSSVGGAAFPPVATVDRTLHLVSRRQQHRRGHHGHRRHPAQPQARPARRPGRHRAPRRRDVRLGPRSPRQRGAARHGALVERHRAPPGCCPRCPSRRAP